MISPSGRKLILEPFLPTETGLEVLPDRQAKLGLLALVERLLLELQTVVLLGFPELLVEVSDEERTAMDRSQGGELQEQGKPVGCEQRLGRQGAGEYV